MLHLQLTGCVKLWAGERALATRPQLRKATAILVILALTEEHEIDRRQLARLLWSRNSASQGARTAARHVASPAPCAADHRAGARGASARTRPRGAAARPDLDRRFSSRWRLAGPLSVAEDIASDLSGIDPSLDAWLVTARPRLLLRLAAKQPPHAALLGAQTQRSDHRRLPTERHRDRRRLLSDGRPRERTDRGSGSDPLACGAAQRCHGSPARSWRQCTVRTRAGFRP